MQHLVSVPYRPYIAVMSFRKCRGLGSLFLAMELLLVISLWRTSIEIPSACGTHISTGTLSSASTFVALFKPARVKGHAGSTITSGDKDSGFPLDAKKIRAIISFYSPVFGVFEHHSHQRAFDETHHGVVDPYCDAARAPPMSIRG
jgi:hypothetical protein